MLLALLAQVENNVEPFLDVKTILILLGAVTPFVTAVLTKITASNGIKSLVTAIVTAAVALVYGVIEEGGDLSWQFVFNGWTQIVVTHMISYFMFLKTPVLKVNDATGSFGVGSTDPSVNPYVAKSGTGE